MAVEHYNRGVELHKGGFLNKAIFEYKEAIVHDPDMEQAYSNLALIYTAQKNWSKALESFDKALSINPQRTTSLNGLGTVLYAMKRNNEAMDKWRKAIEIDPNFASAYYNMGNAYESQENHKEALVNYVKALDVNAKMADAYYRLGSLMNKKRHAPQAQVLLGRAVQLAPDAEFARDARKQIEALTKIFEKDGSALDIQAATISDTTITPKEPVKPRVAAGRTPSQDSGGRGHPKQLIKSIFKRGPEKAPAKNVNMFVQPPSTDSDLKAKPEG